MDDDPLKPKPGFHPKTVKATVLETPGLEYWIISFAGAVFVFVNDKGAERLHEALSFLFFFLGGIRLGGEFGHSVVDRAAGALTYFTHLFRIKFPQCCSVQRLPIDGHRTCPPQGAEVTRRGVGSST